MTDPLPGNEVLFRIINENKKGTKKAIRNHYLFSFRKEPIRFLRRLCRSLFQGSLTRYKAGM